MEQKYLIRIDHSTKELEGSQKNAETKLRQNAYISR